MCLSDAYAVVVTPECLVELRPDWSSAQMAHVATHLGSHRHQRNGRELHERLLLVAGLSNLLLIERDWTEWRYWELKVTNARCLRWDQGSDRLSVMVSLTELLGRERLQERGQDARFCCHILRLKAKEAIGSGLSMTTLNAGLVPCANTDMAYRCDS